MLFGRMQNPVRFALIFSVLLLTACQSAPVGYGTDSRISPVASQREQIQLVQCTGLLQRMDELVVRYGVQDAQAQRIRDFPYLRVNRFLASYAVEKPANDAFHFWVDQLQALDLQARQMEWRNLGAAQSELAIRFPSFDYERFENTISMCSNLLRNHDFTGDAARARLFASLRIVPEYNTWQRVLGLYPISAIFVRMGIERLQHRIHEMFRRTEAQIPVEGRLVRYRPDLPKYFPRNPDANVRAEMPVSSHNPLAIPIPTAEQKEFLLYKYAPVILVDTVTDDDRIGQPSPVQDTPRVQVDTRSPVLYQHISYARLRGQVLLQLNYVFWFPARTRQSGLDIAAGQIDGITWRVTLSAEGTPLLYDAMHNCGCYHQFFPTEHLRLRAQAREAAEPVLVPQAIPAAETPVIRIRSADHFIIRIDSGAHAESTIPYMLQDYDTLRSIPVAGTANTRSLFRPDGIVSGTQRLERFVLWPMGVPNPGEMRQWGHHAIAFIGQRHFDDPDLIERFFDYVP